MMKKAICIILSVCIIIAAFVPFSAFANTGVPVADILDIDYSKGNPADNNSHTYYNGTQTLTYDSGLKDAAVAAFDAEENTGIKYELKAADFELLQDGFSMEAYFYVEDIHSLQAVFSNQEDAGLGIEINKGSCVCCAMLTGNTKYTEVAFDIPNSGSWIHAVMTYDGEKMCIYKDGKLVKTVGDLPSTVTIPETTCFNVGADSHGSGIGDCQNQMKKGGKVNCARLYSYPLSESEVAALYNGLPEIVPEKCILQQGNSDAESVSFGVVSDIHIKKTAGQEDGRYKKALEYFSDNGADSVFVVGDFTDGGTTEQFRRYASICNSADIRSDMTIFESMGNHDRRTAANRSTFVSYTDDAERCHRIINGYHFIMVSPDDAKDDGSYASSVEWLEKQIDIAVADTGSLPVFVFAHHPVKDTVMDSEYWYSSDLTKELFGKYPQLVFFSGHSHISNSNPLSIWQDDFTAVNTATLSYYVSEPSYKYTVTDYARENQGQVAQGLFVSVAGSAVTIKTYDFITDSFIENQIWTFDTATQKTGDISTFPYNYSDRAAASKAPYYDENAKITVDKIDYTSAAFNFPQAKILPSDATDIDFYYIVTVKDKNNGVVSVEKIWSDYFITPRMESYTADVSQLVKGTEYTVSVVPVNVYGKEGKAIQAVFKTLTDEVTPEEEDENEEEAEKTQSRFRLFINKIIEFFKRLFKRSGK